MRRSGWWCGGAQAGAGGRTLSDHDTVALAVAHGAEAAAGLAARLELVGASYDVRPPGDRAFTRGEAHGSEGAIGGGVGLGVESN